MTTIGGTTSGSTAGGTTTRAEESSLSSWAGPYVTEMLGRGQALASMPYQSYQGPLTAGPSTLQSQAYSGLGGLTPPTTTTMGGFTPQSFATSRLADGLPSAYSPQSFTGAGYTPPTDQQAVDGEIGAYTPASDNVLQQYMTPYLQGALQPQYDAANRQNEIAQQEMQSRYGRAGAFGGGRQAVASAELARGALDRMAGITGTGYQNAFQQAQQQFNTEQDRGMASTAQDMGQFNTEQARGQEAQDMVNRYGFDLNNALQNAGDSQRAIEQQGIDADYAQFREQRAAPRSDVLFMQSLLDGLPLGTASYDYTAPTGLASLSGGISGAGTIFDQLTAAYNATMAED